MTERTNNHLEDVGESPITPLYDRLPRGPHQMDRGEVAENQRHRMHGAMVEAVAANGYARTSVRQVVLLAGVSRRAFYEQFANKHDCFLATIDLLAAGAAEHLREAYRSTDGDLRTCMNAALTELTRLLGNNTKAAKLALIDACTAGAPGWMRLTRMLVAFEQMLAESFAATPGGHSMPKPVVRGIVGGVHRLAFTRLLEDRTPELLGLVPEMLDWTLATQSPHAARLLAALPNGPAAAALRPLQPASSAERSPTHPHASAPEVSYVERYRIRILDSALELAALEGYEKLTPLRIVDHAGVSIESFFNSFTDVEECFLAAHQRISEGMHAAIADHALDSPDWPLAATRALERLLRHLAAHPTRARMIAMGSLEMGPRGIEPNLKLAEDIAHALTRGAAEPGALGQPPHRAVAQECVAGAIWHTVYCHAASGRIAKLPEAAPHLAYAMLAPLLGAERAIEALSAERLRHHTPVRGQRAIRLGERLGSASR